MLLFIKFKSLFLCLKHERLINSLNKKETLDLTK